MVHCVKSLSLEGQPGPFCYFINRGIVKMLTKDESMGEIQVDNRCFNCNPCEMHGFSCSVTWAKLDKTNPNIFIYNLMFLNLYILDKIYVLI